MKQNSLKYFNINRLFNNIPAVHMVWHSMWGQAMSMLLIVMSVLFLTSSSTDKFTAAEQQQISIATPGLFAKSDMFNIDFTLVRDSEYSFPLPVGKAVSNGSELQIETAKGDAVKAMFDGTVRLSRHISGHGNVIVVRHHNGLETVYAHNAQNLVKVGQEVKAGNTIAIVGGQDDKTFLTFSIMVNGAKINPETIIAISTHKLRKQTVQCRKNANRVNIAVLTKEPAAKGRKLMADLDEDPFKAKNTFKLDLRNIEEQHWAYPLPGAKVISPYGGKRRHSGVDLKTRPNDEIVSAFNGIVTQSGPYYGYGNCIRIRHAYGFETLYSHQSKNLVKVGDKVKAGQVIGLTGRTGRATTEHLHFEVFFKGRRINPAVVFDHLNRQLQQTSLTLSKNGNVKKG